MEAKSIMISILLPVDLSVCENSRYAIQDLFTERAETNRAYCIYILVVSRFLMSLGLLGMTESEWPKVGVILNNEERV